MVVKHNFGLLPVTARRFRSVNDLGGILVAIHLTAFYILHPPIVGRISHRNSFRWIWVEHSQKQSSKGWWVDVFIEKPNVGIVRFTNAAIAVVSVFNIPFRPAFD